MIVAQSKSIDELYDLYNARKKIINDRLNEFKDVWKNGSDKDIFKELCFCICTPQSRAKNADIAIKKLDETNTLYVGDTNQIKDCLVGVRFSTNKAKYIFEARNKFYEKSKISIKNKINANDIIGTRKWIKENVKGIGYKEASHFLRNIGFGKDLAILDVHILKNLVKYNVLEEFPKLGSPKKYFDIEEKMRKFSKEINISMDELDLLLWSKETGEVFK